MIIAMESIKMKANKKAVEHSNFWSLKIVHGMMMAKPKVNASEIRKSHQKKKDRLRAERQKINMKKYAIGLLKPTKKAKKDMIKYGLDLAKWWNEQHA